MPYFSIFFEENLILPVYHYLRYLFVIYERRQYAHRFSHSEKYAFYHGVYIAHSHIFSPGMFKSLMDYYIHSRDIIHLAPV